MFREMSETEMILRNIKNVKMIDIYELTGINEDIKKGCAAISVFYDVNKNINLCEMDDGFSLLEDWVFDLYRKEKNKQNESSFNAILHDSIIMNERTRNFLKYGCRERDESYLEEYYAEEPVEFPEVAYESKLSRRFLPLISYALKGLYTANGIKLKVSMEKAGWRGKGLIYGVVNKNKKMFAVEIIQMNYSEFDVKVSNFLQNGNVLNIKIINDNRRIVLRYSSEYHKIDGESIFSLHENGYFEKHEFMRDGKKIFCDTWGKGKGGAVKLTEEDRKLLPFRPANDIIMCLPWGMRFCFQSENTQNDNYVLEENKCCQLYPMADYSESKCWSVIKNTDTGIRLNISYVFIFKMLLKDRRTQVYFAPVGLNCTERFRNRLEGRCFIINGK